MAQNTQDKIRSLTQNLRKLWPKYDFNLEQQIVSKNIIIQLLEHTFEASNLLDDLNDYMMDPDNDSIENLIYTQGKVTPNFQSEQYKNEVDLQLALNQVQFINIIKTIFMEKLVSSSRPASELAINGNSGPLLMSNDYAEYYRKVQTFGKSRHWTQDKINKMLSDKQGFNKEYNLHMRQKQRFQNGQANQTPAYIQRLHDDALEREVKQMRAREAKEKAENEEAYLLSTQTLRNIKPEEVRTLSEFMEDQVKYEQKRYENLKNAIVQEESEETQLYQPSISKMSLQILKKKGLDGAVAAEHQRSEKRDMKKQKLLMEQKKQDECSFKPKMNQHSNFINKVSSNITRGGIQSLVKDAERRKEVLNRQRQIKNEEVAVEASRALINSKSDKVMFERFDQDFEKSCAQLGLENETINCADVSKLFLTLGFVRPDGLETEQAMLANIWRILGGDIEGKGMIQLHHCKAIMCCIQNFHIDWIIDTRRPNTQVHPSKLGRFEDEKLFFTADEISYLTKKFLFLYKNRQDKLQEIQKQNHTRKLQQKGLLGTTYTFAPAVSEKNKQLAAKRLQEKEPNKAYMSIEDRLIIEKTESAQRNEIAKKQKDDLEAKQTFRPFVRASSKAFARKRTLEGGSTKKALLFDVWEEQYKAAGRYNKNLKEDVAADEAALLREPEEYIFHPKTAKTGHLSSRRKHRSTSSKRGRTQKQDLLSARGKPPIIPLRSLGLPDSDAESEEQTFQISVAIAGSKIQMQAKVDTEPSVIAQRFIKEHDVDVKHEEILTELIQKQIDRIKEGADTSQIDGFKE